MKRSKHSLSHYKLLTCDMGELIPIACYETLPGDTIQQATSALIRVSPLVTPVMHPVRVRIHHWFVPFRLIWEDFEDFITGGPDGNNASVPPYVQAIGAEGGLADYFGLHSTGLHNISALPYRAYALIYNEFYRDQDLQTELTIIKSSGNDSQSNQTLKKVNWEKDYFTSARPWTQKGADITVPLAGNGVNPPTFYGQGVDGLGALHVEAGVNDVKLANTPINHGDIYWDNPNLLVTVEDLKHSLALQRFAEARAKYGSRYSEYLRYLGVRSADARLSRPEYLGGGRQSISFSEVLQTSPNYDANEGVGNMKGHGIGAIRTNRYRRFFEEHGLVMTLMSVMPKSIYAHHIPRMLTRQTREDFYQRELEDIGQDEVLNSEVYADHSTPNGVFGYQDRYDEYRRIESGIAGEFRSTLDEWHMARIFTGDVALNASFVEANPTKRILASQNTDSLYCMVNHSIQARRMLRR